MRTVLVCGAREWTDHDTIRAWLERLPRDTRIVSGACRGADEIAAFIARQLGLDVFEYPADWSKGKGAGFARNQRMLDIERPDRVLAFTWIRREGSEDITPGTGDCCTRALKAGIACTLIPPGARP